MASDGVNAQRFIVYSSAHGHHLYSIAYTEGQERHVMADCVRRYGLAARVRALDESDLPTLTTQ